ncbi:MAG: terpene cyclase/mutase family protein, partial [bacterium]|nr:terpene cyclase/mutase family protein [bacterium]
MNLRHEAPTRKLAAHVLLNEPGADRARTAKLVRTQLADGSWKATYARRRWRWQRCGRPACRQATRFFERGYRFMRVLQQWDGNDLIQSGCDISTMLHAVTLRSLLLAGGESQELAGSALVLLQQQDQSGGWSVGSGQSVDVITTAQALDALALFGDDPPDTRWARRRAAEFLLSVQQADGSWAVLPKPMAWLRRGLRAPGSLDATSLALLALTECGESFAIRGCSVRAVHSRAANGERPFAAPSSLKSRIGSTMLAAEALDALGGQRALVERALDWIAAQQHALGGFGE